jgi:hypothetical protein
MPIATWDIPPVMPALLVIGGVLFLIGVVVVLIKNWKRRQRIITTPASLIAQAPGSRCLIVVNRHPPVASNAPSWPRPLPRLAEP